MDQEPCAKAVGATHRLQSKKADILARRPDKGIEQENLAKTAKEEGRTRSAIVGRSSDHGLVRKTECPPLPSGSNAQVSILKVSASDNSI